MVRLRCWIRPLFFCLTATAAATLLLACGGTAQPIGSIAASSTSQQVASTSTPPPPANTTSSASVSPGPNFSTSGTVDGSELGLIGDGVTDNTSTFRALLGTGDRTIHISAGVYVTGKLDIPSNTILILDSGATIEDSGQLGPDDPLITIEGSNVYIAGTGAHVLSNRSYYVGGEQRHGVFIYGASNVVIDGLESSNNSGDGFYVGGPQGQPSQDITLQDCMASNNRRQGLSITSARNVKVVDCQFQNTNGTAPQFGIDLEPNLPTDSLSNIQLLRPFTRANAGGGIQICLIRLNGSSQKPTIDIVDHASEDESPPFKVVGLSNVATQISYNAVGSPVQNISASNSL